MPALKRTRSFYGNDGYERLPKKSRKMYERSRKTANVRIPRSYGVLTRSRAPFPDKTIVTLRYCDNKVLDAVVGTSAKVNFSCNSLYDPNRTDTGHQPYGFDQYAAIYNHYKVLRSRITVTGVPASVGQSAGNLVLGIAIKDDTTTESDMNTMREAKACRFTAIASNGKGTVTNYWRKSSMFPSDGTYSTAGLVTANPGEEVFFNVFSTHIVGSEEPGAIDCLITIDYTVEFFELKDLGQS